MQYQIWRHLIQILSFRKDIINSIKPFIRQLNNHINNEKYNINEEKHIPFLKSFSNFQLKLLYEYEIIDEEIHSNIVPKQTNSLESSNNEEKMLKEIIEGDKNEELQK